RAVGGVRGAVPAGGLFGLSRTIPLHGGAAGCGRPLTGAGDLPRGRAGNGGTLRPLPGLAGSPLSAGWGNHHLEITKQSTPWPVVGRPAVAWPGLLDRKSPQGHVGDSGRAAHL